MTDTTITGFFTLGGASVGAILGFIGTYVVSLNIAKHTDRLKVCARFRAVFARALAVIDITRKYECASEHSVKIEKFPIDFDAFFREELLAQASAVEMLKIYVPRTQKAIYQKTWDDYYKTIDLGYIQAVFSNTGGDACKKFENKIHTLLHFAE